MFFNKVSIHDLDERFRVNLINSLSGFKSANLIGTVDRNGNTNLALFSSAFHIGANPPLMGLLSRPDSVPRDTLNNIKATGQFTINHVNKGIIDKAHQTSARFDASLSEFDLSGLTAMYLDGFPAPFVEESHIQVGLELIEVQRIKANNTHLIIGEVVTISAPDSAILQSGSIDCESVETVTLSGLDTYHTTHKVTRMAYAKANQPPRRLND